MAKPSIEPVEKIVNPSSEVMNWVRAAMIRAYWKHGAWVCTDLRAMVRLAEEVGEVATAVLDRTRTEGSNRLTTTRLREELSDVASACLYWMDQLDREEKECTKKK